MSFLRQIQQPLDLQGPQSQTLDLLNAQPSLLILHKLVPDSLQRWQFLKTALAFFLNKVNQNCSELKHEHLPDLFIEFLASRGLVPEKVKTSLGSILDLDFKFAETVVDLQVLLLYLAKGLDFQSVDDAAGCGSEVNKLD